MTVTSVSELQFQRDAIRAFRFTRCSFDAATGVAQLVYAFDGGPELIETITVPGAPFALDDARAAAAERALQLLHLIAGVSYYKAAVPDDIRIESYAIDTDTAELLETIYVNGLGEFAYRNGLNLHGRIQFPYLSLPPPQPSPASGGRSEADGSELLPPPAGEGRDGGAFAPALGLRNHALVAIGGGKDSLVSIQALRHLGITQTVTWIGGSQLIAACAERTGLPTLNI